MSVKTWIKKHNPWRNFNLVDENGQTYLGRKGITFKNLGGIYIHHIETPDPGTWLHDHPWTFWSYIISGGYHEEYNEISERGDERYIIAPTDTDRQNRGRYWKKHTLHHITLGTAHRITHVQPNTKTIILKGPIRRPWGFYTNTGWEDARYYTEPQRQLDRIKN